VCADGYQRLGSHKRSGSAAAESHHGSLRRRSSSANASITAAANATSAMRSGMGSQACRVAHISTPRSSTRARGSRIGRTV